MPTMPEHEIVKQGVLDEFKRFAVDRKSPFTPHELVDFAREKPGTELHRLLFSEPDDVLAGRWRLTAAGMVIRAAKIVAVLKDERSKLPTARHLRQFVAVDQGRGRGYVEREEMKQDPHWRANFISAAMNELHSWCRRYADIDELSPIRSAITAEHVG